MEVREACENETQSTNDDRAGSTSVLNRRHACSELVTIALLLTLALCCLDADFLVVFFESRQVLTRLRELALFHALANVPVHERTLGVHKVKLVVDAREDLCNR